MPTSKYVDILLAQNTDGESRAFVVPTSIAHEGDIILHDGCLFTVVRSAWFGVNDDTYLVIKGSTPLYIPDKILRVRWEREDETEADNGTDPGDS